MSPHSMSLGPYASFIIGSYAIVTIVVVALIAWIALDYRRQKQRLRDLEASGVTRRSRPDATDLP
jgi:heme exporter protein D